MRFNVGGRVFEIYPLDCEKSVTLRQWASEYRHGEKDVFMNHNPDAFGVVIDYLRYGRILVPPSVCAKTVELVFDDLEIELSDSQRMDLLGETKTRSAVSEARLYDDVPPQYTPIYSEKTGHPYMETQKTGSSEATNLVDQLTITVHQKITDLIFNTIRPVITSQALQGAFRTTCVLLPSSARHGVMMSEFPQSSYTETIYLDKDLERFLTQPEAERRFEHELRHSLEVPIKFEKKDVFFRSENEFGIAQTTTAQALVIEFELGRQLA